MAEEGGPRFRVDRVATIDELLATTRALAERCADTDLSLAAYLLQMAAAQLESDRLTADLALVRPPPRLHPAGRAN